jgi:hypothetical protein
MFCCERELWATPLARCCGELLLVGLQLACKHVQHLVTQGGIVHVAMLALEEKVEQVLPAAVRWNELHKVHHHCCVALIKHHEQMIKDLALALTPSAPVRLKSEFKKVLEGLGVTFCASISDDVRHKRADAGLVKTTHRLVEQDKERVTETLRRELCMLVLASPVRRGNCASMRHLEGSRS